MSLKPVAPNAVQTVIKHNMQSVVLGISGGVDSAVAAFILKNSGYDVTAVFLKMHGCASISEQDAKAVCETLGIKFVSLDVAKEFDAKITDYFVNEYLLGRTPNPCVRCNAEIKFNALLNYADENGIEKIATGHYCGIFYDENTGRYAISKSNTKKDQSYMLSRLPQSVISRIIFPLNQFDKETVRKIAIENNIPVAEKPDSQEICFIPDNDYVSYIEERKGKIPEGDFYLEDENKIIGKHKGIIHYTTGQRKRLGIAVGVPLIVKDIDAEKNIITVTKKPFLSIKAVKIENVCYQKNENFQNVPECFIKLRYTAKPIMCKVIELYNGKTLFCEFFEAVSMASKGQTAVLTDENGVIIASGEISEVIFNEE